MFEREAEEYVLENFSSDYYGEFEMKQITEYSAFQKGAEFGYNKANEWHYVKGGDFPTDRRKMTLIINGKTYEAGELIAYVQNLEKENAELKKNYEDSLVACGVLKARVDTLAQPSPLESMQDVLITTQKAQNEKQREQLTKAKDLIEILLSDNRIMKAQFESEEQANIWFEHIHQAEQFLKETE